MRTLGKVMRIFDEHDIEEWELPPLRHFIREKPGCNEWHVLPGQKLLTTLLQSIWMVLRVKASKSSQAQGGPATPLSAFGSRNSHALRQTSRRHISEHPTRHKKQHNTSSPSSMAFFGLRKWPTPVSSNFSIAGPCIAHMIAWPSSVL